MISALCLGDFWFIKLLLEAVLSTGPDLLRLNIFFLNSTPVDLLDRSDSLEVKEREDFVVQTDLAEEGRSLSLSCISSP